MRIVILEGSRGVGKSTLGRVIREKIPEITLVNPVGFHLDGNEGFDKVVKYYLAWNNMISSLSNHNSTFVFDRYFFTERVFSELYKSYDFKDVYETLLDDLSDIADVDVIFLTCNNSDVLKERLTRDKVPFANVVESTVETFKQQNLYKDIMSDMQEKYSNPKLHVVDTTNKTPKDIEEEVFKIIKREET